MTAEEIKKNYEALEDLSKKLFDPERHKKVMEMFKHFQSRMISAPASSRKEYHNAFPGGWIAHTVEVINNAIELYRVWEKKDAADGFTVNEVVFAAMFHDWGKLGDIKHSFYIPHKSEWHRKRGMLYEFNPNLKGYMKIPMRSIFLLQHYGIIMTENEYMGIMLSDGMFDEINKAYFNNLKTNLPLIIHHADHMSTQIEKAALVAKEAATANGFKQLFTQGAK